MDKWTETFEIKPPKRTQEEMKQIKAQRKAEKAADAAAAPVTHASTPQPAPQGMQGGLIQQILSYPLSERTPMENYAFIQQLKQQITSIL